jgi:hypothetical protein
MQLKPRILTYERKLDDTTTFDVNLFSRVQTSIAACFDLRKISQENRGKMYANNENGILAVSLMLDIHFGPDFELQHLELFVERIGTAKAKEVRYIMLKY